MVTSQKKRNFEASNQTSTEMKKFYTTLLALTATVTMMAQGWPANYGGVMLQGFYWDSYDLSRWSYLESKADQFAGYFDLVWIPQSARAAASTSMGYDPLYWFSNYNSSFGNEQELRSMIGTFRNKGIGTIADVVINHRGNVSNWVDFPAETYNGVTYQLQSTDIVRNDDNGATRNWATANGYSLSDNNDSGEGWDGMRDLDHLSTNVQENVKAYLGMLLNDFGYAGVRYDMVKGYSAYFTGFYNSAASPTYSVGEYWDGNPVSVINWINGTKIDGAIQSAAFDFPFRYTVRDAIGKGDWTQLANNSVMSNADYRRYAVTFVENHDTEQRANAAQDPIKNDTLAANAFLLAMPGTPCVFYKHFIARPTEIKAMIDARKAAGITNTSQYTNMHNARDCHADAVEGSKGRLVVVVGNVSAFTPSSAEYREILMGPKYKYFLSRSAETVWADKPSGEYNNAFNVTLTAVSADDNARIAYTLDGSAPTAASTTVASGTTIAISEGCTLRAALVKGSTVGEAISRNYWFNAFQPYTITVYTNADAAGWNGAINYWTWGGDGTHAPANSSWPGDKVSATTIVEGKTWYYKTYTINSETDCVNFVFSTGSGSPQTVDVNNVNADTFFEISAQTEGGKHLVNIVQTGISETVAHPASYGNQGVYSLDGRRMGTGTDGLRPGVYIMNGRKVVIGR